MATSKQKALEWDDYHRRAVLHPIYSWVQSVSMEELLERYEMDEWREPISVSACPPRFVCFDSIIRARIAELRRQAVASAIRVKAV